MTNLKPTTAEERERWKSTEHMSNPMWGIIRRLVADYERVEETLEAIVRCECTFSRDPLEHARNAVQHCRDLALEALNADED